MEIAVIGTGYVGLVAGTCFAELGIQVTCIDQDLDKISKLQNGQIPIFEPGLEELVKKNLLHGSLRFTTSQDILATAEGVVVAVGTPSQADGNADLSALYQAVEEVARKAQHSEQAKFVLIKSTVPIGTAQKVRERMQAIRSDMHFEIISNPEFLREGSAVPDFLYPDRIIAGCATEYGKAFVERLYRPLTGRDVPLMVTDNTTAELIKYAANSYLAMRIAFINEMADLAEKVDANINDVATGMGLDHRIGKQYLHAGPGFGGSCFPKDTLALSFVAHKYDAPSMILDAVISANNARKIQMAHRVLATLENLSNATVAVLGLAFKADTDDMRDSSSIDIINALIENGVKVKVYDPAAMLEAEKIFNNQITYCTDPYMAAQGADTIVIVTEWSEFRLLDLARLRASLRRPILVDLRNIFIPKEMTKAGFTYISIGHKTTGG